MRVEKTTTIDASREEIWELVSDPCCYPAFMHGVTRLEHKSEEPERGFLISLRSRSHGAVGRSPIFVSCLFSDVRIIRMRRSIA